MKVIGMIPARMESTRFPDKPLALINGKPMIQRVYEQAKKVLDTVYVVTDSKEIAETVKSFNGNWIMTSVKPINGTERCAEALKQIIDPSIIINIQGDLPFIDPTQIQQVIDCFKDPNIEIATLIKRMNNVYEYFSKDIVKVVMSECGNALYFSRQLISKYKHIGIYGYRAHILQQISLLPTTNIELTESLEQLRWLYHGYDIKTVETQLGCSSIDTPKDLKNYE